MIAVLSAARSPRNGTAVIESREISDELNTLLSGYPREPAINEFKTNSFEINGMKFRVTLQYD